MELDENGNLLAPKETKKRRLTVNRLESDMYESIRFLHNRIDNQRIGFTIAVIVLLVICISIAIYK